ncbi:hypothetical protein AURDEDRAFT_181987 [Auricularia subglabra TFB-10046 SS5]|nr:hypothetical protein AURDEDRAFT_181987 [Auricularia subglabra TFB-10046 SS5]
MRTLRLVSKTWAKVASELLFEFVGIQSNKSSAFALSQLANSTLASYVRICELALCGPDEPDVNTHADCHMHNAFVVRQFTKLRELNLLFIHEWTPDASTRRDVSRYSELRRAVLLQLFDDLGREDFIHIQYLTLRIDADSFVHCMHEFDGSRAKVPRQMPPRSVLRRLGTLVHLDLCLSLEDETGHTFYDYPTLGHYITRIINCTSHDRLRTLSLSFNASPNWRLRQYNHMQAPFLDKITLPRLQNLFLEDMHISAMELGDFVVEHLQPKYRLRNVYIAGMLMPLPPLEPTSLDLGGWAQFCRDLSPYKNKPLMHFEAIGYEHGFPLREMDVESLQRTTARHPLGEIMER